MQIPLGLSLARSTDTHGHVLWIIIAHCIDLSTNLVQSDCSMKN